MLRGNRGDAAGVEPGASSSKRSSSEHGTVSFLSGPAQPVRRSGWVHRRPIGTERGGAAVVVRGRESRSHGQGRQRDQQGRDGNVQRYRGEYLGHVARRGKRPSHGYGGCRPNCTSGRRLILAAGSMICTTWCSTRRRCRWRSPGSRAGLFGAFSGAFVLDVADRQPQQLDHRVVVGEVAAVLDDLPQLVVQRLDRCWWCR